jgi:hypothetical protein
MDAGFVYPYPASMDAGLVHPPASIDSGLVYPYQAYIWRKASYTSSMYIDALRTNGPSRARLPCHDHTCAAITRQAHDPLH